MHSIHVSDFVESKEKPSKFADVSSQACDSKDELERGDKLDLEVEMSSFAIKFETYFWLRCNSDMQYVKGWPNEIGFHLITIFVSE